MTATAEILKTARVIREQLRASKLYAHASIRDAVELAADNFRQISAEAVA